MNRHEFLQRLHTCIRPRTYLETGVQLGQSMTLSRVPSIGIDPAFSITEELRADVFLARTTTDEFFAQAAPLAHLPIPILDFAFIDGMHLSEYALRDYLAIERFTLPTSVVVFDDMLPRSVQEAARHRVSAKWTGDVYKAAMALRRLAPELIVLDVDTKPTGTVLVLLPDAARGGVLTGYDDWLDEAISPDPQPVPGSVLERSEAVDPAELVASKGWRQLRDLRRLGGRPEVQRELLREAFGDLAVGQRRP